MALNIVKVFHADHGVSEATMAWALQQINPVGFFLRTLTLPADHADLSNGLYGPLAGDAPVSESAVHYANRGGEGRGASRMVNLPKRATRLVTIIGSADPEGVTVYTCYGGPCAEREPTDPSIASDEAALAAARAFWAQHALAAL